MMKLGDSLVEVDTKDELMSAGEEAGRVEDDDDDDDEDDQVYIL
jgi:hypothetical protein